MKITKRIISLFLVLSFIFLSANAAEISTWAVDEIGEAITLGLIPEDMQTDYTAPMTRAEFAYLVMNFLSVQFRVDMNQFDMYLRERPENAWNGAAVFTDIEDVPAKLRQCINFASQFGIVNGIGDGKFTPNGTLTREQAATMMLRAYAIYADLENCGADIELDKFADRAMISDWAKEAVGTMFEWDVMLGYSGTEFAPKNTLTREQCCLILLRLYKNAPVSRKLGNQTDLYTTAEAIEWIESLFSYEELYRTETDRYIIIYCIQSAVPHGGNARVYVIYKDGGFKTVRGEFPRNQMGSMLLLKDLRLSDDGLYLYCTSTHADEKLRIDLEKAVVEKIWTEAENGEVISTNPVDPAIGE